MIETRVSDWLLEAEAPTIRYRTLTELMGQPEADPRAAAARAAILEEGPAAAILAGQAEAGYWPEQANFYQPKYRSTHWSLTLLVDLLVDGDEPRFRRGVEWMLGDRAEQLRQRIEEDHLGWSCLFGNILRYTCHAGLADDERTAVLLEYTLRDMDNGYCRCEWNNGYACAWGVARTLWGLAALPQSARTAEVQRAIDQGLAFLLQPGRLVVADYPVPDGGKVHAIWSRLNYPLFYQVDILFVLRVVNELGALWEPAAQEALAWLQERRLGNGRWRGSSPYRTRTYAEMGDPEETSRWVTLQAAKLVEL